MQWRIHRHLHRTITLALSAIINFIVHTCFTSCNMSSSGNVCHASFKNMCLALQIAVKPVAVCVAVFAGSSCSLKPTKYFSGFWPEDVSVSAFLSVSFLLFLFFFVFHLPSPCHPQVFCGTCHHATRWRCPSSRTLWPFWPTLWSSHTRAGTPPRTRKRTANCTYTPPRSSAMPPAVCGRCLYLFLRKKQYSHVSRSQHTTGEVSFCRCCAVHSPAVTGHI